MKSSRGPDPCRWILDDGPFNDLADFAVTPHLIRYPPRRLLIPGATAHAAQMSPARESLLEVTTSGSDRLIDVIRVGVGGSDPAGEILLELHGEEKTTTNLAEREAIAWSLVHGEDAVFVTYDIRAAMTALAELGRTRVAYPFDLWIELFETGGLEPEAFRRICDRTKSRDSRLQRMPARVTRLLAS